MKLLSRSALYLFCFITVAPLSAAFGQFNLPGSGSTQSKQQPDDQKVNKLLHDNLPLVLDANTAYSTVPNEDLLGGPFKGRALPITLDTLTKPLPPGDYVVPMTFFCSEYSIHRGGQGVAYTLGPAQGSSAKAITTLLWRGMLTGHSPQELQSVSWAIQGSVPYDKMPARYRALVDQLIPDMKNQVNGQGFANIETGYQGMINKGAKKVSDTLSKGLGAITGGRGRVDVKVDVELNGSFARLGRLGQMALDGESISSIVTASFPSDQAREQALYAGQGQQSPPIPAIDGPWSVAVPGTAYMRFAVHGGNLQGDNVMQIRVLRPKNLAGLAQSNEPHFKLAAYQTSGSSSAPAPSLLELFGGHFDESTFANCMANGQPAANLGACEAKATVVAGVMGYGINAAVQAPNIVLSIPPSSPNPASPPVQIASGATSPGIVIQKLIYNTVTFPDHPRPGQTATGTGLCAYFGATSKDASGNVDSAMLEYRWTQTIYTNSPMNIPDSHGTLNHPFCKQGQKNPSTGEWEGGFSDPCEFPVGNSPPYYRPDAFDPMWHKAYPTYGYVTRDIPFRTLSETTEPADLWFHVETDLIHIGHGNKPVAKVEWGFTRSGNSISPESVVITDSNGSGRVDSSAAVISSSDSLTAKYLCDPVQIGLYNEKSGKNNGPLLLPVPEKFHPTENFKP